VVPSAARRTLHGQHTAEINSILPHRGPSDLNRRLLLFGIRRLASAGLNDAHAAHAMLIAFGRSFRRPLILLRAMMAELSRASDQRILVAPCCCMRVTTAEHLLLQAVAIANDRPREAYQQLQLVLGTENCLGALSSAQAVSLAFADLGKPLETSLP
jgi:hypothetical protein